MMRLKIVLAFFPLFCNLMVYGQPGAGLVEGQIIDGETKEFISDALVQVDGTTNGTKSTLDGKFSLKLNPGTYTVRIKHLSFESIVIEDVNIISGETTQLGEQRMFRKVEKTDVIKIKVKRNVNNERILLDQKKNSANVTDGVSQESIKEKGDGDVGKAAARAPGVSLDGGKYVFVRGLGDRYTKTVLNGLDIPGLDPDRNSLQMDIFPTNMVDNIIIYKSFTADLSADFTGGLVDIATKNVPYKKEASLSFSGGYNPNFHFNPEFLTYSGGKTDFLGFDDGSRDIPATTNIPFYTDALANAEKAERYKEILSSFNPNMAAFRERSLMDYSVGANWGNRKIKENSTISYNLAFSYKNSTEFYKEVQYSRYGLSGDLGINEMESRELQVGSFGENNVLLSGLAGLAVKKGKNNYRISLLHLQNGESRAGIFNYYNNDQGAVFEAFQHNLDYSQRALSNVLLEGQHSSGNSGWDLVWKISPTFSSMDDPDVRFTRYQVQAGDNLTISTESGFPARIWRNLQEKSVAATTNVSKEFDFKGEKSKLKFGAAYTFKERDFVIRNFDIVIKNIPLTGDPNELFEEENLWPYQDQKSKGTTYDVPFLPNNPNAYNAVSSYAAGYASTELNVTKKMKAIAGLRIENYIELYTGQDQLGVNVLDNEEVINDIDVFPTLNLVYAMTKKQNFRISYAKTIARPSLKELSYAQIFDPLSGRTFIGGLSRDADDAKGIVYWDGNLKSTDIHNIDLRWEVFQEKGQTIALSGFYKNFINPIEIVQFATQTGSFQPRNVGDGMLIGVEAEWRKNLNFINRKLENFSMNINFTYTQSQIKYSTTEKQSRTDNARDGQVIGEYRVMAGQAPYLLNGGITYNGGSKGFFKGMKAGFFYNMQGQTLQYVGIVDRPDIYSVPFHSLNFNANKVFGKDDHWTIGAKVDNILGDKKEMVFKSYGAQNQFFTSLSPGRTFQVSVGYKFF